MVKNKDIKGMGAEKDEFSEWFTQIILKADLADYSSVSGCIVFKPQSYEIWDKVREEVDKRFKKIGIQNVYFPLFISEKTFDKLKEHTEGFAPEVAWVTHGGNAKLKERLAIRPTSETIMYESYAKWIRSWRDLPLLYNQWNNVVRWEFKHPVPFLRTREFLWNEGHTVYATKKDAEAEGQKIIGIYRDVCENYLALPALIGRKTDKEKFAGADYTLSMEYFMPNGKAIQGPDWHHDGQHFSKAYGIEFLNKDGRKEFAWQNTFAISTRMLGVMFAIHSDSKGLVLPPKIINKKVVVIPIIFEDSKKRVLDEAGKLVFKLKKFGVVFDEREGYSPGYKFNEWDLKGIPIKIEIGPNDIKNKSVVVSRRDTGKKQIVGMKDLDKYIGKLLLEIQENLFKKAKKLLYDNIEEKMDLKGVEYSIYNKKISFSPLCKKRDCEDNLKHRIGGAKVLNIPFNQPGKLKNSICVVCGEKADYYGYIGKSY